MMPAKRRHLRIKESLRLRGSSLSEIARDLNVSASTVTIVSQGHRRSERIERAIAQALGLSPSEVWPDRYPAPPHHGGSP
jgi:lambda repressor-like predicted transcriptional regulator